jgi:hypothetical protein
MPRFVSFMNLLAILLMVSKLLYGIYPANRYRACPRGWLYQTKAQVAILASPRRGMASLGFLAPEAMGIE